MSPTLGTAILFVAGTAAVVLAVWLAFVAIRAFMPDDVKRRLLTGGGDPASGGHARGGAFGTRTGARTRSVKTTSDAPPELDEAGDGMQPLPELGPAARPTHDGVPEGAWQQLTGVNRSKPGRPEEQDARLKRLSQDFLAMAARLTGEGRSDTAFGQARAKILAALETGQFERAQALLEHAGDRDTQLGKRNPAKLGPILTDAAEARALAGELKMLQLQPANAIRFFREAVSLVPPDNPALVISSLDRWGDAAADARDINAAVQAWQRALELRESALGIGHKETMTSRDRLIGLYIDANQPDQARIYLDKSLAALTGPTSQRGSGSSSAPAEIDDTQVIARLQQLATLLRESGRIADAADLLEIALTRYELRSDADPARLAAEFASLALLRRQAGDAAAARKHYSRALGLFRRVLGAQHPDLVQHLDTMAQLHAAQGDGTSALNLLKEAEAIERLRSGDWHPRVVTRLYAVGRMQTAMGLHAEAEANLQQGLKMHEEIEGPEHADVATGLELLGSLYAATNRADAAAPLLERALGIVEFSRGLTHPALAPRLTLLADVYRRIGRGQAAIAAERRAADVQQAANEAAAQQQQQQQH